MAASIEPPSSLSFTSSHLSNGSNGTNQSSLLHNSSAANLEVASLSKLSSNLEQLLIDSDCGYSDAEIIINGVSVGVHRCILAARSKFFLELFKKENKGAASGKPNYHMKELLPFGHVGQETFLHFLNYIYTGRLKPFPMEVSTCVDTVCAHDSCRPAIDFAVELMYASSVFQVPELVSSFQRRLCNFVEKSLVENVLPILLVAFNCKLALLLDQCVERVARSDLDRFCIEKELPFEVSEKIKQLQLKSPHDEEDNTPEVSEKLLKKIGAIHKALDSDDVELVKLLSSESDISLDQANALHYAVAYCDPKVVAGILSLDMADVNLRNSRGYTVLHFAAMRKEPSIIISLLKKGANASDLTLDGRNAVNICRRLTRPKDYHVKLEKGQESHKDRICIDIMEREIRRNPMAGDIPTCSHSMPEDLQMRLLYLEKRVGLAQSFFPAEAKVAMDIANVEGTFKFTGLPPSSKGSTGNLTQVDLNETPHMQTKRLRARMEALMKTVETGRRYFPYCSEVLDKYMDDYMDDDFTEMLHLEKGSPRERRLKRMRYKELKEDVQKAYKKDKEAKIARSCLSASSSASSLRDALKNIT
ncbi:PREDICTED: regulatory protein NPR3-like [Tarenaya hassleriana]|uniref:regulatory protein NPR3-like n=1 Tax=Tarenaya hassleriana TaxID=28532 RepID=UPI00053C2CC3|nr:PREDICTED: regulatory protein NPR3-like [Tarenaya hassleriana]